ncbi:insulinase family protein [Ectobacillus sp. JY-23]|uniref:EF-P 5-aminopentanol modification-associated protein YfmF n=1 Tax=Ectobacillus sp. JY-23 TaxID=2933872 RepID=UPI001FF56A3F|nr:pitrilysin family protein [Ectobacillus sp. JY-23]UOY93612.1 insulinase family protein [Ectobacillus sp. JY-23]
MEQQTQIAGLRVHTVATTKYKTNTLVLRMKAPLSEETVTQRALLPYVLQSGTKTFPTVKLIRQHLEELYGASLGVDVSKKGEHHIISFYMDVANEVYLQDAPLLLEKAIKMLAELILHPITEDDVFVASIVESEKRSLLQRLESVYDDKMRYANDRLLEEMCQGEAYRFNANGIKEKITEITPASLFSYYQQVLREDCLDLYVIGDVNESVEALIQTYFTLPAQRKQHCEVVVSPSKQVSEREVIEKQDLKQSKLHIGYRTHVTYKDTDYFALQVFNGLFGGFSHSKLFINVREKNSLAYYAASRYESHKGLLFVMSGIEAKNYKKAVSIINEQLEAMQNGDFTEQELQQTKAVINNQILETIDTPRGLVEMLYHNVVADYERPIAQWEEAINSVTKEEVVAVAKKIETDTVYLLQGEGA